MLVVHATFPIDSEKREEALEHAHKLVDATREEDGVVEYNAAMDVKQPTVLRFSEQYEDAAAFEAHVESDHFAEFEAALPELLDGKPEATRFEVADATELDL